MNGVEGFHRVPARDDAGDINFIRALRDHLDVYVSLTKGREHAACHTDMASHVFANEREDSHLMVHGNLY